MILTSIEQAVREGARLRECCRVVGISLRTVQRWRKKPGMGDERTGPKSSPGNKLSRSEEEHILKEATSPKYRALSPKQIVPLLADEGIYLGSESTFYRLLRRYDLAAHRGPSKPRESRTVKELEAAGPNEVWTWDISYLRGPKAGVFYYLYLIVDIWSRKIVGARIEAIECGELAADLASESIAAAQILGGILSIHMDNGTAMKSTPFKAALEALGVAASYSRARVSNDNAYSESLFRTLKYRPEYPRDGFCDIQSARDWLDKFIIWYNEKHLHSSIGFVTPADRHDGLDTAKLSARRELYETARRRHPERWTTLPRKWSSPLIVTLNPAKPTDNSLKQPESRKSTG